jgi:hypothetical protein
VNWVNDNVTAHTVTANDNSSFDSGNLNSGSSFSFAFGNPGIYLYHCSYHSWMHGTIKVVSASAVPEFPGTSMLVALFVVSVAIAIASHQVTRRNPRPGGLRASFLHPSRAYNLIFSSGEFECSRRLPPESVLSQ